MAEQNLNFEDKLSMIIDGLYYFEENFKTSFVNDNLSNSSYLLTTPEKIKVRNELYNFMVGLYKYDNFPNVVDDEEYFKIEPYKTNFEVEISKSELFTASKDFFHNYNLLYSKKYYKGLYKFSNGIYASTEKENAIKYANAVKKDALYCEEDINLKQPEFQEIDFYLPFKMPGAKIIKDTDLIYIIKSLFQDNRVANRDNQREIQLLSFINNLYNDEVKTKLEFVFNNDLAKLAIVLGYDAIYITKDYDLYFQVLNRAKIIVSSTTYSKAEYEMIFRINEFKID